MSINAQILAWQPESLPFVLASRPRRLKVLDANLAALGVVKREIPDCRIDFRLWKHPLDQPAYLDEPEQGARKFADELLFRLGSARQHVTAVEGLNETGLWDAADAYSTFTAEFARIMRREGLKSIAYNFPIGNPSGYAAKGAPREQYLQGLAAYWVHYYDGLAESDYLGLHEYGAPKMQSGAGWWCLRYRDVWDVLPLDCRKPILITECGIDGALVGRESWGAGWRNFASEEEYLGQLQWYAGEIAADRKRGIIVDDFSIFHGGSADATWYSFSVLGCEQIAAYMRDLNDQEREEQTTMPFEFKFGFEALHDAQPDVVGEATSEQVTIPNVFAFQFTTRGMLIYRPGIDAAAGDCKFFAHTLPPA